MQDWILALEERMAELAEKTPGFTHSRLTVSTTPMNPGVMMVVNCEACEVLGLPAFHAELYDPRFMTLEWSSENVPHFAQIFLAKVMPRNCKQRLVDKVMGG